MAVSGVVLLWRARGSVDQAHLSMWILMGVISVFVPVSSFLVYVLFFGFGVST